MPWAYEEKGAYRGHIVNKRGPSKFIIKVKMKKKGPTKHKIKPVNPYKIFCSANIKECLSLQEPYLAMTMLFCTSSNILKVEVWGG